MIGKRDCPVTNFFALMTDWGRVIFMFTPKSMSSFCEPGGDGGGDGGGDVGEICFACFFSPRRSCQPRPI